MISDNYYDLLRTDVLNIIPPNIKSILSVGCATGRTERELIKKGIDVFGIELNHEAANIARERGIIVLEGDVSAIDVGIFNKRFDFIIYADVLEHLPDPVSILRKHMHHLKTEGEIFISVPNFRHYSVIWELFICGHIVYKDAGILDRTHIRITTRKMVLEWFNQVGLIPKYYNYVINGRKNRLISAFLLGTAKEFLASQIGLLAKKNKC